MMDYINIMSIDPGTNMGISIISVSVPDLKIQGITTSSIDLSTLTTPNELQDNLLLRTQKIQIIIRNIMDTYHPRVLAMEAAFVNVRFPRSVIYLSHYISAINLTITEADPFIKIFNYPPKKVKATVSGGTATKEDMMSAVSAIKEITSCIDPTKLTEHEVDSIAIGYTYIKELRDNPVLMLMI